MPKTKIGGQLGGPHNLLPIISGRIGPAAGAEAIDVRCLVDTGADGVYLKPGLAQRAGMQATGSMNVSTPLGAFVSNVWQGSLWLPATVGDPMTVSIFATDAPSVPAECDLLLGMGVLRLFHMTFWPSGAFELTH